MNREISMKRLLALLLILLPSLSLAQMARVRPPVKNPSCDRMPTIGRTIGELCTDGGTSELKYWNGANWVTIGQAAGSGRVSPVTIVISEIDGTYNAIESGSGGNIATSTTSASDVTQAAYDYVYNHDGGDIVFAAGTYNWTKCVSVYPQNPGWVRFSGSGASSILQQDVTKTGGGAYNFFCLDNGDPDIPGDYRWFWFQDFQMDSRNKIPAGKDYPSSSFFGEDANLGDTSGDATGAKARYSLYNRSFDGLVVQNVQSLNVKSVSTTDYIDASSVINGINLRIRQTNSDMANVRSVKNVYISNYRQVGGVQAFGAIITNDEGDTENSNGTFENISIINSYHDVNVPFTAPNVTSIASTCWHIGGQSTTSKNIFLSENMCKNSGDNCVEINQGESVFIQNNTCENVKNVGLTISNLAHPVSNTRKQNLIVDGWYQECTVPAGFDTYYNVFCNVLRMEACPDTTCYPNGNLSLINVYHHNNFPKNFYNNESIKIEGAIFKSILLKDYTFDMDLTVDATQSFSYSPLWISVSPEDADSDGTYSDSDVTVVLDGININYSLDDQTASESYIRSLYGATLSGQESVYRVKNFNVDVTVDGTFGAPQNLITAILLGTQTRRPNYDIAGTRTCSIACTPPDPDLDGTNETCCSNDATSICTRDSDCYFDVSDLRNVNIDGVRVSVNSNNPSATAPSIYGVVLDSTLNVAIDESELTNISLRDNYAPTNRKNVLALYGASYAHPNVLCPDMTQSSWTCYQAKNAPDYINVALASTSGLGTATDPWTGFDLIASNTSDADLYFPCGYYSVDTAVYQSGNNVTFRGDGDCTILTSDDTANSIINFNGSNLTVRDMKFDGEKRNGRTSGKVITADGEYQKFEKVHFFDGPERILGITDANHLTVKDCVFEQDATPNNLGFVEFVTGNTTDDTKFIGNTFDEPDGTASGYVFGIFGTNSNIIISNNEINGKADPALNINSATANNILVSGNHFLGTQISRIFDGNYITFSNNTFTPEAGGFIFHVNGGSNISIVNNTLIGDSGHGSYGLVVTQLSAQIDNLLFSNNLMHNVDGLCGLIQSDASYTLNNVVLTGNVCIQSGNYTCWYTDAEASALSASLSFGINRCVSGSADPYSVSTDVSWTYNFDEGVKLRLGGDGTDGTLKIFNETGGTDYESCVQLARCGSFNCIMFDGDCNFSGASDQSCWIMDSSSGGQDKNCDGTAD